MTEIMERRVAAVAFDGLGDGHFRVRDVSLKIEPGTFNLFCGEDGCGRTLLLRLLALLETPDAGDVLVQGISTCAPAGSIAP